MQKLSELDMDTTLTIDMDDVTVMTKKDFLEYYNDFLNDLDEGEPFPKVTIAERTFAAFNLENIIGEMQEQEEMYEDWEDKILVDIDHSPKKSVIVEAESEIQRIFRANPTYWEGQEVELDMDLGPEKSNG